jgi:hypothetical protein
MEKQHSPGFEARRNNATKRKEAAMATKTVKYFGPQCGFCGSADTKQL